MAVLDLIGRRVIQQGSRYELTIRVDGDFSAATFQGSIRAGFTGDLELAVFSFSAPTYDSVTGKTSFLAFMPASVTAAISAIALNLRYDIKAALPSQDPIRLLQGRVVVSPQVRSSI